jgi:DNA-binding NtrC family response regulator
MTDQPDWPRGGSVLVVDDEALIVLAVTEALQQAGVTAHEAYTAQEAMDLLARDPSIVALLTDVRMPSVSGPELADRALKLRPELAVVFITGFASRDQHAAIGRWPVLHKPFPLEALLPTIRQAMRIARGAG